MHDGRDVTRLLDAAERGDRAAAEEMLALVYAELRDMAAARLAALPPGQTLQPTALVHEAYLKLLGGPERPWPDRRRFLAAAARAMRNVLVDEARRKGRRKREGGRARETLSGIDDDQAADAVDMLALEEALAALEAEDPLKAEIVHLRYFVGLTIDETAAALGVAPSTVDLHWKFARAVLQRALDAD
ncbi:MAG: ECF-type sigma factor [Planctomycetota bacterium]